VDRSVGRRELLGAVAVGTSAALAGCDTQPFLELRVVVGPVRETAAGLATTVRVELGDVPERDAGLTGAELLALDDDLGVLAAADLGTFTYETAPEDDRSTTTVTDGLFDSSYHHSSHEATARVAPSATPRWLTVRFGERAVDAGPGTPPVGATLRRYRGPLPGRSALDPAAFRPVTVSVDEDGPFRCSGRGLFLPAAPPTPTATAARAGDTATPAADRNRSGSATPPTGDGSGTPTVVNPCARAPPDTDSPEGDGPGAGGEGTSTGASPDGTNG